MEKIILSFLMAIACSSFITAPMSARAAIMPTCSELLNPQPVLRSELDETLKSYRLYRSQATAGEAEELIAFAQRIRSEFVHSELEWDNDILNLEENYLSNGGYFLVIRTLNGELVGTGAVFNLEQGKAELRKLYLAPEWRGKGLGRIILKHLVEWAREQDYLTVQLETYAKMESACKLYESFGFARKPAAQPTPATEEEVVAYEYCF